MGSSEPMSTSGSVQLRFTSGTPVNGYRRLAATAVPNDACRPNWWARNRVKPWIGIAGSPSVDALEGWPPTDRRLVGTEVSSVGVQAQALQHDSGGVVRALLLGWHPLGHEVRQVLGRAQLDQRPGAGGGRVVGDPVDEVVHEGVLLGGRLLRVVHAVDDH